MLRVGRRCAAGSLGVLHRSSVRRFASRRTEPLIQKLHQASGADIIEISRDRIGVAVLNIGTPKTTETKDVRDYLRVFLGDFRVLDLVCPVMPNLAKRIILEIILATPPKQSGKSYAEIWDEERGSPLFYLTEDLCSSLQEELGNNFLVKIGMRYSEPFIDDVMKE